MSHATGRQRGTESRHRERERFISARYVPSRLGKSNSEMSGGPPRTNVNDVLPEPRVTVC